MKSIKTRRSLRKRAQTMTEYAIIVALIAIACIGAVKYLGGEVSNSMKTIGNELEEGRSTSTDANKEIQETN